MLTKIQKWGNSLALRIPKVFADDVGLENETSVELRVVGDEIHILPIKETRYELDALLADVTPDNLHDVIFLR